MHHIHSPHSSRIPIMLLNAPPPDTSFSAVKIFVSQPRRIAAKALVERVRAIEPKFRDAIALRMGHGVREYESRSTKAWFVTTGYLVRLVRTSFGEWQLSYAFIFVLSPSQLSLSLSCPCNKMLPNTTE